LQLPTKLLQGVSLKQADIINKLKKAELDSDYKLIREYCDELHGIEELDKQIKGLSYYYMADYKRIITAESALDDFAKAKALISPEYFFDYSMDASCWHADQLFVMGNSEQSEQELLELLEEAEKHNSLAVGGSICRLIGQIYHIKKEYDKALEYFFKSLEKLKKSNQYVKQTLVLNNIGQTNIYTNAIDSLKYIQSSRELSEQINYPREEAKTYYTQAELYMHEGRFDEAQILLLNALEKLKIINYSGGIEYSNFLMAHNLHRLGKLDDALELAIVTLKHYLGSKTYPTRQVDLLVLIYEISNELELPKVFAECLKLCEHIVYIEQYTEHHKTYLQLCVCNSLSMSAS
jgi:tetratricopeptide (TPR) repeat protein